MFDKIDDDLIKQLIEETCELVEEELKNRTKRSQAQADESAQDETQADDVSLSEDLSDTEAKAIFKKSIGKAINRRQHNKGISAQEAVLEFIQREDGKLILQELGDDEPMVSIEFSDKIIAMIGKEHLTAVGQSMIQAAITSVMHRQMNAWHAHVYDEEPKRYS